MRARTHTQPHTLREPTVDVSYRSQHATNPPGYTVLEVLFNKRGRYERKIEQTTDKRTIIKIDY